jgi:hypothetical protein
MKIFVRYQYQDGRIVHFLFTRSVLILEYFINDLDKSSATIYITQVTGKYFLPINKFKFNSNALKFLKTQIKSTKRDVYHF